MSEHGMAEVTEGDRNKACPYDGMRVSPLYTTDGKKGYGCPAGHLFAAPEAEWLPRARRAAEVTE